MKQNKKTNSKASLKSIRFKIVILLLLCIVLALGSSYMVIIPGAKQKLILSLENNMMDLTDSNSRLIDKSIEAVNETMTTLSHSQDIYTYMSLGGRPFKAQEMIDTYLKDNDSFSAISIYDGTGKIILSSDEELVGSDGSSLPYVMKVLNEGGAAQSDILLENVEEPSIICAIPLLSTSDDPIGVICVTVPSEYITGPLIETKIKGIDTSFAYLISKDGNIIYHPDVNKIGSQSTDSFVKNLINEINKNQSVNTTVITSKESGSEKYVSYSVSSLNNWITLISADKNEMEAPISQIVKNAFIAIIITLILLIILGYIVAMTITRPILQLTKVIIKTADLNFRVDMESEKLSKRSDETGEMSRAIINMRHNIKEVIERINVSSEKINEDAIELNVISDSVTDFSSDNSATTEQLAAGMQETSATTESIHENINYIEDKTKEINSKSLDSILTATEILDRAEHLKESTLLASKKTEQTFIEVKEEVVLALERSKAVNKINKLTAAIMEIAEQTGLLSLNASIEAARAGEAGKGFAVVASEIGHLADQSSKTVSEITAIISEVTVAVNNIDGCLKKTLNLIEESVLPDYQEFISASNQYHIDANTIHKTMGEIQKAMEDLSLITTDIAQSISDINHTIGESAEGVADIAGKTSTIVELTTKTSTKIQDSIINARELEDIVNRFTL